MERKWKKKKEKKEFKYSNYILLRDSILSKHDRISSEELLLWSYIKVNILSPYLSVCLCSM